MIRLSGRRIGKILWKRRYHSIEYRPKNGLAYYNAKKGYWKCDWVGSQKKKDNVFYTTAKNGGFYGVNWDELSKVARDNMEMEDYILLLRPFGEDGPVWKVAFRFLRVAVLVMHVHWDDLVRVLCVHGAPGKMFESSDSIEFDDTEIDNMGITALSMDFWHQLVMRVQNVDDTPTTMEDILACKKEDDFLYTFGMSVHNRMFGHLCGRTSTHMQKNELSGRERNLNRKGETGMERTAGSSKVVGKNQRKQDTINNRANDETINRDNKFQVGLVSAALGEGVDTTIEEAVPRMLAFLKTDRVTEGKEVDVGNRMRIVKSSRLFVDELLDELVVSYEEQSPNPGNKICARSSSSSKDDMKILDADLTEVVNNKRRVFIQAQGRAFYDNPTNQDGSPFKWPEDGTIIESEPGSDMPSVTFRRADILRGITHAGLLGRTLKGVHGEGKSSKQQSKKFYDYDLMLTLGIAKYDSNTLKYINPYNVMEVYVKSSENPFTPTGKKKNRSDADVKAEYDEMYPDTIEHFRKSGKNVKKLEKIQWFNLQGLRDRLKRAMAADRTKLAVKT